MQEPRGNPLTRLIAIVLLALVAACTWQVRDDRPMPPVTIQPAIAPVPTVTPTPEATR